MGKKKPKTVRYNAAGGIVLDESNHVLLLERVVIRNGEQTHEIRLPKGHIEKGETPEDAALREVCEESGYCQLKILADMGKNHVTFDYKKKHVERDEQYFLMRLTMPERQSPTPSNQHSEESKFTPLWADSLAVAEEQLTFESEKEFVRRARTWCKQHPKEL